MKGQPTISPKWVKLNFENITYLQKVFNAIKFWKYFQKYANNKKLNQRPL